MLDLQRFSIVLSTGLHRNLSMSLFGQHIVIETLVKGLRSHYESGSSSKKPLVLSFHGPPGTGKNFVADRVASFIYPKGLESRFVHKFMGRVAYPVNSRVEMYKVCDAKTITNINSHLILNCIFPCRLNCTIRWWLL